MLLKASEERMWLTNLFDLPFLQVCDLLQPLAFCRVVLRFHNGGFNRTIWIPQHFLSDSRVSDSPPIGVQVLARHLIYIL